MMFVEFINCVLIPDYNIPYQFVCGECGKSYKYKGNLDRHVRIECQKSGGRFSCPNCHKVFKYKHVLERHFGTANCKREIQMMMYENII